MSKISAGVPHELVRVVAERYRAAGGHQKGRILDEFVALTAYHRKHAIRVLNDLEPLASRVRTRSRLYDEAVRQTLIVLVVSLKRRAAEHNCSAEAAHREILLQALPGDCSGLRQGRDRGLGDLQSRCHRRTDQVPWLADDYDSAGRLAACSVAMGPTRSTLEQWRRQRDFC